LDLGSSDQGSQISSDGSNTWNRADLAKRPRFRRDSFGNDSDRRLGQEKIKKSQQQASNKLDNGSGMM